MFLLIIDQLRFEDLQRLRGEIAAYLHEAADCHIAVIDAAAILERIGGIGGKGRGNEVQYQPERLRRRALAAIEAAAEAACAVGIEEPDRDSGAGNRDDGKPDGPSLMVLLPEWAEGCYGDMLNPERLAFWLRRDPQQFCACADGRRARTGVHELLLQVEAHCDSMAIRPWADAPVVKIETPRLALTVPTMEQLDGYYEDIVGTDMFRYLLWNGPSCVEDLKRYWVKARQSHARGVGHTIEFAIIHHQSDAMIGGASYRQKANDPGRAEIGYTLSPEYQRQGFGTEAVGALIEFGFTRRAARRIDAEVFTGNVASRGLLEKLGFTLEGTHRQLQRKQGLPVDCWMFAMTSDDWLMQQRRGAGVLLT